MEYTSGAIGTGRCMEVVNTRSPGALEELDDIGNPTDGAWSLHRRYFLQDRPGQRREIALMYSHLAEPHRAGQATDKAAYGIDGRPGRLLFGHLVHFKPRSLRHQSQA